MSQIETDPLFAKRYIQDSQTKLLLYLIGMIASVALVFLTVANIVPLPQSPFSVFYLSHNLVPYIVFVPLFVVASISTIKRARAYTDHRQWYSEPYIKLALSLPMSVSAGLSEEIERWGYVFLICTIIQFIGLFVPISWSVTLLIAVLITLFESFLDHRKRKFGSSLRLFINMVLYAWIMLNYGLFTAILIHTIYDVLLDFVVFCCRLTIT